MSCDQEFFDFDHPGMVESSFWSFTQQVINHMREKHGVQPIPNCEPEFCADQVRME